MNDTAHIDVKGRGHTYDMVVNAPHNNYHLLTHVVYALSCPPFILSSFSPTLATPEVWFLTQQIHK